MSSEEHFRKLERMYLSAPTNQFFRPRLRVGHGTATLQIDIRPECFHAAGAVHGSVYFKALDDAAYFAVNSLIEDVFVLTASFNIHFLRPVTEGTLTAIGHVVHRSRSRQIAEAALQAAGIEIVVQGEGPLGLFPLGPAAFGLRKNLVEASILVEAEDVADARTILAGVDESESS